jgi:hypothetical protein
MRDALRGQISIFPFLAKRDENCVRREYPKKTPKSRDRSTQRPDAPRRGKKDKNCVLLAPAAARRLGFSKESARFAGQYARFAQNGKIEI